MEEEKKELTLTEQAEQQAKNYFRQGLNCTECVLASFLDVHGSDLPREIMCMATGFGGGMGHTKHVCGAVTGAVMALSLAVGRKDPLAKETMADRITELNGIYGQVAPLVNEMEETYGTLICSELSAPHGDFECKARKKSCMQMIGHCASLAMKYALECEGKTEQ